MPHVHSVLYIFVFAFAIFCKLTEWTSGEDWHHPIGCSICHRIPKPTSELGGKQFQFWDSMVNLLQRCSVARLGNSSDRLTIFWLCSNFNNWPRIQTLGSQQSRSCQPRTDVKNKVHDRCPLHQTPPITSSSTVGSITPCPN